MTETEEHDNKVLRRRLENNCTIGYFLRGASLFVENHVNLYSSSFHIDPRVSIITFYGEVGDYQIANDRNFINVNFEI